MEIEWSIRKKITKKKQKEERKRLITEELDDSILIFYHSIQSLFPSISKKWKKRYKATKTRSPLLFFFSKVILSHPLSSFKVIIDYKKQLYNTINLSYNFIKSLNFSQISYSIYTSTNFSLKKSFSLINTPIFGYKNFIEFFYWKNVWKNKKE